jgi:hypothetical protein
LTTVAALLLSTGLAIAQSQPVHGRWQWTGTGDYPPEVYFVLYLDMDGVERADIGELLEPNLANGTTLRPLITTHAIVRRVDGRNVLLIYADQLPEGDLAEFVLQPNGNISLAWLPWGNSGKLMALGHWPSDAELSAVIDPQHGAFRRRLEMVPAKKDFPDLN